MNEELLVDLLSPSELATLSNEHVTIAVTNFALFLSLISGYLVAAYLAGAKLERHQVMFINTIFSCAAIYFALTFLGNIAISSIYIMNVPRVQAAEIATIIFLVFALVLTIGMLAAILYSIRFMKEIKENDNQSST